MCCAVAYRRLNSRRNALGQEKEVQPNHYYDFEHATAALSYCDAFLTEGSLHSLVTQPQVKFGGSEWLPRFFRCRGGE